MSDGNWRLYLLFGPHWNPFFEQQVPAGTTHYVRSQPITDRSKVGYDHIPWEHEPANLLSHDLYVGKLVNLEGICPVFFGFQKVDAGSHFMGGLSDPQWAIFTDDGTIQLSDKKPLMVS